MATRIDTKNVKVKHGYFIFGSEKANVSSAPYSDGIVVVPTIRVILTSYEGTPIYSTDPTNDLATEKGQRVRILSKGSSYLGVDSETKLHLYLVDDRDCLLKWE